MFSQSDDDQQGWILALLMGLILLVLMLVIGLAIGRNSSARAAAPPVPALSAVRSDVLMAAPPAAAASSALPVPAPALSAQAVSDAASITVEYGIVKFYFASGNAELAAGASAALVDVVKGARGGKKVKISGFHDDKGNPTRNAELARQRALAVREALLTAGVPAAQIQLEKPAQTAGSGSDAEARRVEISLY